MRVAGLREDLEQLVVGEEVEAREGGALRLEIVLVRVRVRVSVRARGRVVPVLRVRVRVRVGVRVRRGAQRLCSPPAAARPRTSPD